MKLQFIQESFSICKPADVAAIDMHRPFCFAAVTDEEVSLVCPTRDVPKDCRMRDDGWCAMRIAGKLDLSLIGILSPIADILANNHIGIFAVSTFDTDYVFIREKDAASARMLLGGAGYELA